MSGTRAGLARSAWAALLALASLALASQLLAPAAAALAEGATLAPPTALRFADPAAYDVVDARVLDGDRLRLHIELGAIDPSGGLPLGITQPIVEVYLDTVPGGAEVLLPGSGMRMPPGDGWNLAVRVTGDGAWGWVADEDGSVDLERPVALDAVASGRSVTVLTPFEGTPGARLYAITGVYDPFRPDGWRPTTRLPSPWAFSSPEWSLPVVDVFPADAGARAQAVARGVLPRHASVGIDPGITLWVALMLAGLAIALAGLWWRRRTPPAVAAAEAPKGPRYRVLEHPAWTGRGALVADADPVDGDLLIGEGDLGALLARLDATVGSPREVTGGEQERSVSSGDATTDEPASGADVAATVPPGAPLIPALPAPDPFADYERATHDAIGAEDDVDEERPPATP